MLYHCGLLSERPERDPTLQWVKRGAWDLPGHPPEIEHDRRVWLSMPGFSLSFHVHTMRMSRELLGRHHMVDFEELREDVAANWLSATREDCVRLCHMRPRMGDIPLLVQLQIMNDVKAGARRKDLSKEYGINMATITHIGQGRARFDGYLPSGFELLIA